jgi:DNA modification methylase
LVADRLGRNGIGVELSPEYARMAKARIYNDAPLFADIAAD